MRANVVVSKPKSDGKFSEESLRPESASSIPTDFRSGESLSKQDQIRKVFSISLRESDQRRLPERNKGRANDSGY